MGRSAWGSLERRGASWDARWRDAATGKPRRKRVGGVAELGEQVGEATRGRLLEELRARVECRPGIAFAAFLDSYEHVYRVRVAPLTFATTYPQMRRVAAALPQAMDAVTEGDAEAVVSRMGLCARSTRTLVLRLRAFWRAAERRKAATSNPWLGFPLPKVRKRLSRVVTAAGLDAYVSAAPEDLKPLVRVLGETGLRTGEASALRFEDVQEQLVVRESKSEPRRVFLTPAARGALGSLPRPMRRASRVFPMLRTPGRRAYALRRFVAASEDAGLEAMRFHDLRHSTGYRMALAGASAKQIGHALGITEQTAKLYSDHRPDELGNRAFALMLAHERAPARKAE